MTAGPGYVEGTAPGPHKVVSMPMHHIIGHQLCAAPARAHTRANGW